MLVGLIRAVFFAGFGLARQVMRSVLGDELIVQLTGNDRFEYSAPPVRAAIVRGYNARSTTGNATGTVFVVYAVRQYSLRI